ncbi:MAG: transposase [Candidatus Brocadiales bacterium]|nr:transposase [Candidatus Brocadiales bacterium]
MFRKTDKESQVDLFSGASSVLAKGSLKQYTDSKHWHNQFRDQIVSRIDESIFKVLFNETTGAPNASVSLLIGMMVIKEAFGWSDSQLFEQCKFNLLVRSALGLFNLNDVLPAESTYYLLRKRMYEHHSQTGEDLMELTFKQITRGQVQEFDINGQNIRMDSKLLSSNIAFYSRYEIIHHTLILFYKVLDDRGKKRLTAKVREQIKELIEEEPQKTVYRSNKSEIESRLEYIGTLMYMLVRGFKNNQAEQYQLLCRVFNEQYILTEDKQIQLRQREEIDSDSTQSPHDPDSAFRKKGDQKVKGYSANVTETVSDDPLNLITDVKVDRANASDTKFVQPAIESTTQVTGQEVRTVYADGAYQSPDNEEYCKDIDMVFTGIQGYPSRYDLEMTPTGLLVTDTQTGERFQAVLAKKRKNSKEDRWRIKTDSGWKYFNQLAIRASELRRTMKERPIEELQKRNNVEATIFQLSFFLRNNKSRYRGQFKLQTWAYARCLWINLVRINNFMKQTCQRTCQSVENAVQSLTLSQIIALFWPQRLRYKLKLSTEANHIDKHYFF